MYMVHSCTVPNAIRVAPDTVQQLYEDRLRVHKQGQVPDMSRARPTSSQPTHTHTHQRQLQMRRTSPAAELAIVEPSDTVTLPPTTKIAPPTCSESRARGVRLHVCTQPQHTTLMMHAPTACTHTAAPLLHTAAHTRTCLPCLHCMPPLVSPCPCMLIRTPCRHATPLPPRTAPPTCRSHGPPAPSPHPHPHTSGSTR